MKESIFHAEYKLSEPLLNGVIRKRMKWGLMKYSIVFGLLGAKYFTDRDYLIDDLNIRPDLSQMRILTPGQIPVKEKKVFEILHDRSYFGMPFKSEPVSIWKQFVQYWYP